MRKNESLFLLGANTITSSGVLEGSAVLVENGRIARIFADAADAPREVDALDLAGLTLWPGFVDLHIHGALGVDVNDADADGLREVARYLAGQGVTSWLPTLVPGPVSEYQRAARAAAELRRDETLQGARVLGLHYEGPFVNEQQCGALRAPYFRQYQSAADLDGLEEVPGAVHLTTLAPEIAGGVEVTRVLRERGWVVSIGHTRADLETLDAAWAAGASHITHFMNAMLPLHHRNPGPVGWGLAHDEITCDIIADGIHLHPLALQLIVKAKGAARVALISDAVAPTGLGDGDFSVWNETISVAGRRTSNAQGSIAGSVISLLDAVKMMLSLGLPPVEVAQMAATTPARVLRVNHETGSIETGQRADLTALDADGNPRLTIIGGKIVFPQSL
jgi:N-acetylglucosamine-6-phosphate deacetylase